jgi:hypothetical protein
MEKVFIRERVEVPYFLWSGNLLVKERHNPVIIRVTSDIKPEDLIKGISPEDTIYFDGSLPSCFLDVWRYVEDHKIKGEMF